jgi:putative selenate reductase molybdopterin-binding subunit
MDGASHFNTDSPPPFCATFAEVEVDTETGQVRVLHLATAVDPGTAINPCRRKGRWKARCAGHGLRADRRAAARRRRPAAQPEFPRLQDLHGEGYAEADHHPGGDRRAAGPYGAKSISEVPINGPAPAIANAIFHAVGCAFASCPSGRKTCCARSARAKRHLKTCKRRFLFHDRYIS